MKFLGLFCCFFFNRVLGEDLPSADNVSLIFVGFRHGFRNPAQFFPNDTQRSKYGWGWEGASQLTVIGKKQAYSLGKFLRDRYKRQLSSLYFPSQIKAITSSAERCQQTLLSVLAGLYPPKGRAVFEDKVYWQPVPIEINDPLLRMYNVKCPTYKSAYQPISDDNLQQSKDWLKEKSKMIQYVVDNTGFNGSLSDIADAADNLQSIIYNEAPLPSWIESPKLSGYTKQSLIDEILSFGEAHQIQCAEDEKCAQAMAGLWLNEIVELMEKRQNDELPERRVMLYAAHTETVLSLMKLMKLNVSETPTSGGFILEFKTDPPSLRAFRHESDPKQPTLRHAEPLPMPYCAGREWCPLDMFIDNVASKRFRDWRHYCQLPSCSD